MAASNWITVTESTFPWEREALEFVRSQLPKHEPWRAWSNFEFIADDGTINEVDLLAFSPQGFFLIEIKSRPGRLLGGAGTWTWEKDGKLVTTDNPLILATPEIADARELEDKLERAVREGFFIALMVSPKSYELAIRNLSRFPVEIVDMEGVFISALRDAADQLRVNWDLVLKTDAKPHEGHWERLMRLVSHAMPAVESAILRNRSSNGHGKTVLLTYAGMLARYDKMSLFERLREEVGRRDGLHGVWILVPGDDLPLMDGKAIPLLRSGQCTRIPTSWLKNEHRTSRLNAAT